MTSLYLDTNFFIYLSDSSSPFYKSCLETVKYAKNHQVRLLTSAETIQEIIYLAKNTKRLAKGLKTAKKTMQLCSELLSINKEVIGHYLKLAAVYKKASSRDLIRLAACLANNIDKIVSFDQDFAKFSEISLLNPQVLGN